MENMRTSVHCALRHRLRKQKTKHLEHASDRKRHQTRPLLLNVPPDSFAEKIAMVSFSGNNRERNRRFGPNLTR